MYVVPISSVEVLRHNLYVFSYIEMEPKRKIMRQICGLLHILKNDKFKKKQAIWQCHFFKKKSKGQEKKKKM